MRLAILMLALMLAGCRAPVVKREPPYQIETNLRGYGRWQSGAPYESPKVIANEYDHWGDHVSKPMRKD